MLLNQWVSSAACSGSTDVDFTPNYTVNFLQLVAFLFIAFNSRLNFFMRALKLGEECWSHLTASSSHLCSVQLSSSS